MTALVPTFSCFARLRPFKAERDDRRFPVSMSLQQVFDAYGVKRKSDLIEHHFSDTGIPIHESQWGVHYPGSGGIVTLRAVATGGGDGGGKQALQLAGMLGLMVGVPWALGPAGALLTTSKTVAAIATMGSLYGWNSLTSAPDQEQLGKGDIPTISYASRVPAYEAMPRVIGKIRLYPPHAARPYLHSSAPGGDRLYMLFWLTAGASRISNIKIGEDPIDDIDGVEYETVTGTGASDDYRTIAPPVIHEESWEPAEPLAEGESGDPESLVFATDQSTHMLALHFSCPDGLYYCIKNIGDSGILRRLRLGIRLRFQARARWPAGGGTYSLWKVVHPYDQTSYEYRHWITGNDSTARSKVFQFDFATAADGYFKTWLEGHSDYTPGTPVEYQFATYRYEDKVLDSGTWVDPDTATNFELYVPRGQANTLKFVKRQSLEWVDPIDEAALGGTRPPVSVSSIGLRIDPAKARNVRWDALNCVVESYLPYWNGSGWTSSYEGHLDAAYYEVLMGEMTSKHVRAVDSAAEIDRTRVQAWGDWCRHADQQFRFNGVFDRTRKMDEVLAAICFAGRASYAKRDGKHSVVYDYNRYAAGTEPVCVLSPRNTYDTKVTRFLPDELDGIRVQYRKEGTAEDFVHSEQFIMRTGVSVAQASNIVKKEFFGITDSDQVENHATFMLNCARLRLELRKTRVKPEWLVMNRGDLVVVSDDVAMIGNKRGRIKEVTLDGSDRVTSVELDEQVYLDSTNYKLRVQSSNRESEPHWHAYRTPAITYGGTPAWVTTVAFTTPIDPPGSANPDAAQPEAGDLFLFGHEETPDVQIERHYLVLDIRPDNELGAQLTLVEEANNTREDASLSGVYDMTTSTSYLPDVQFEPFPEYWDPPRAEVVSYNTDETVMYRSQDGTLMCRIALQLFYDRTASDSLAPIDRVDIQMREAGIDGQNEPWQTRMPVDGAPELIYLDNVEQGRLYDVRLRTRSEHNRVSIWTEQLAIEVIGMSTPPPPPENISFEELHRQIRWAYPDNPPIDLVGFEIRRHAGTNAGWDNARPLHRRPVTGTAWGVPGILTGEFTFYVASVDAAGNYSTPASITLNLPDPDDLEYLDVSATYDWKDNSWPNYNGAGSSNGYIDGPSGDLVATDGDEPLVYVSEHWEYQRGIAAGDGADSSCAMFVIPEVDCTAEAWYLQYQVPADWNASTGVPIWPDEWIDWPGRVALTFQHSFNLPLRGGIAVRFRIVCLGQDSGQARITQCEFRRAFPPMIEIFEASYSGSTNYFNIPSKPFTHIISVGGRLQPTNPGVETYPVTTSVGYDTSEGTAWWRARFYNAVTGSPTTGTAHWIVKGYRSYAGYTDPAQNEEALGLPGLWKYNERT